MTVKSDLIAALERGDAKSTRRLARQFIADGQQQNRFTSAASGSTGMALLVNSFENAIRSQQVSAFITHCCHCFKRELPETLEDDEEPSIIVDHRWMSILTLLKIGIAASPLKQKALDSLRTEYAWIRRDARTDKGLLIPVFAVLVEIIRICLREKNPLSVDPLLKTAIPVDLIALKTVPKSILTTLMYLWARHLLFMDRLDEASKMFQRALELLGRSHIDQKRKVLKLLVPIKLCSGRFLKKRQLTDFQLADDWAPIMKALKRGDIRTVRQGAQTMGARFDTQEVFCLFGSLELIAFRVLLKKVSETINSKKIQISVFSAALRFSMKEDVDDSIALNIATSLVSSPLVNGYLSFEEETIMLASGNPFPSPPWSMDSENV